MTFRDISLLKSDILPSYLYYIPDYENWRGSNLWFKERKIMFLWASQSAKEQSGTCRNENRVKNSCTILERSLSDIQHQADSWNHRPATNKASDFATGNSNVSGLHSFRMLPRGFPVYNLILNWVRSIKETALPENMKRPCLEISREFCDSTRSVTWPCIHK